MVLFFNLATLNLLVNDNSESAQSVCKTIRIDEINGDTFLFTDDGRFSKSLLSIGVLERNYMIEVLKEYNQSI